MGYIAGIGGANVDIHGRSDQPLIMRDSNPGTLHVSLGGVCRNICENLARLGENVRLVSVVGNDMRGRSIIEGCERVGIDVRGIQMIDDEESSSYISIMDEDGDMLLAMSDMSLIKKQGSFMVDRAHTILCGADLVVCDGNLSMETIERLTRICSRPLYLDPVSTTWAKALRPIVGRFDTVKPNLMELEALTDYPVDTPEHLETACDILRGKGVRRVFVSLGRAGMFYKGPEGALSSMSRPFDKVANATGAGDAAMAGIIWATLHGWDARSTMHAGMAAGMVAIASRDTINREMSPEAIKKVIKEYIR